MSICGLSTPKLNIHFLRKAVNGRDYGLKIVILHLSGLYCALFIISGMESFMTESECFLSTACIYSPVLVIICKSCNDIDSITEIEQVKVAYASRMSIPLFYHCCRYPATNYLYLTKRLINFILVGMKVAG